MQYGPPDDDEAPESSSESQYTPIHATAPSCGCPDVCLRSLDMPLTSAIHRYLLRNMLLCHRDYITTQQRSAAGRT